MIITIGGQIASGKTVLARGLSEKLNFKHISAGEIMREMAQERGMTLLEFSDHAEGDHLVDKEIDDRQKELAQGDCVVDGRLSAYFLDSDLKIWLTAPLETRAKRLMGREKKFRNLKGAMNDINARESSEKKRYMEIYGISMDDLSIYDIILNTEKWDIEGMVNLIFTAVKTIK